MTYGESNGHVTDDVTSPRKVKLVTQIGAISRSCELLLLIVSVLVKCRYRILLQKSHLAVNN